MVLVRGPYPETPAFKPANPQKLTFVDFPFAEWVIGSPNIDASNFTYLWLYLTIPNGVWVAIPVYLAWESIKHYFELLEGKKVPKSPKAKVVPAAAKPVDAEPIAVASPIASAAPKSPRGRKPVKK